MAYEWRVQQVGRKTEEQVAMTDVLLKAILRMERLKHPEEFRKLLHIVLEADRYGRDRE